MYWSFFYITGLPSSPNLVVTVVNSMTLNFTIWPPATASQCVRNYIITSTDSDGIMQSITVEADDTKAIIEHLENGFIICNNIYSFTIVANTVSGPGERSDIVIADTVDFSCKFCQVLLSVMHGVLSN